jgi:hypothetical protein
MGRVLTLGRGARDLVAELALDDEEKVVQKRRFRARAPTRRSPRTSSARASETSSSCSDDKVGSKIDKWGANEKSRSRGLANGLELLAHFVGAAGIEPVTPTVSSRSGGVSRRYGTSISRETQQSAFPGDPPRHAKVVRKVVRRDPPHHWFRARAPRAKSGAEIKPHPRRTTRETSEIS